jgi:hypothetical protein
MGFFTDFTLLGVGYFGALYITFEICDYLNVDPVGPFGFALAMGTYFVISAGIIFCIGSL